MGYSIGYGYGILSAEPKTLEMTPALEKASTEAIDLDFLLEDEYPLLVAEDSGNRSQERNSFVLIKSSVIQDYDKYTLELPNPSNLHIADEENKQLRDFCDRFGLENRPAWRVFFFIF